MAFIQFCIVAMVANMAKDPRWYTLCHLSLYSIATQNTWRRGLVLGNAPDARILRWGYQHVGIFWHYLTLKFTSPPTPNIKFALPPTPTPDASQWNIGGVGSPTQNFCFGHVHFMLFMSISFAPGTQHKLVFQWTLVSLPLKVRQHLSGAASRDSRFSAI